MDPLTLIVIVAVLFVLFLMATAGGHRHRLEKALNELETERMRLMKSIQHIRVSFYKKQMTEEEAQKLIFEHEEKLRGVQEKILQIKEKPLLRTLKQHEAEEKETEVVQEEVEVVKTETTMMSNLDAKVVVILFVVLLLAISIAAVFFGGRSSTSQGSEGGLPPVASITLPMTAVAAPEKGTYPGSTAGIRVTVENTHGKPLKDVLITAKAPEGSGIRFEEGEIALQEIKEFEAGGVRELFFMVYVDADAAEGEYKIGVTAQSADLSVTGSASANLIVRIGLSDREL